MSQEQLDRVKLTPKDEKMLLASKLPPFVSVVKVARQLGIPPRVANELVEKQTKVPVYRIGDGKVGGLMVDVEHLGELKDILLVRINDPANPKPRVAESAIKEKLGEPSGRRRQNGKLDSREDAERILQDLREDSEA